jgi:multidrug efflux pump subunit AcrA (membrane-fusion protein)
MKKIALKGFTIFLVIMFLCTVISRAADSLTVAKVTVETAGAKKIEHIVEAEGMVEKNRELAVLTESDLLVKTVYVKEGEKVEENAVLAEIDVTQLEEVMQGIRNEIKVLQLQNEQAQETESNAKKARKQAKTVPRKIIAGRCRKTLLLYKKPNKS